MLRTFDPATAPTLYRDALRNRAQANHSLPDYALLRPLLSATEATAFVQAAVAAARRGHVAFAAQLQAQSDDVAVLRGFVLELE